MEQNRRVVERIRVYWRGRRLQLLKPARAGGVAFVKLEVDEFLRSFPGADVMNGSFELALRLRRGNNPLSDYVRARASGKRLGEQDRRWRRRSEKQDDVQQPGVWPSARMKWDDRSPWE